MKLLELYRRNRPEFFRIVRYLIVGGWNTLFGVGLYTLVYELWGTRTNYLGWAVAVNILAITNAYLCYKFFVFRTKGNYLREYLKCYTVYGAGMLLGMGGLFLLVSGAGMNPAWANFLLTGVTVVLSYFGHKYFSFRRRREHE